MKGQWVGAFSGDSIGILNLEIDERDDSFSGRACLFENDESVLVYVVQFVTRDKCDTQNISTSVLVQRISDPNDVSRVDLAAARPNIRFPNKVDFLLKLTSKGLRVSATMYFDLERLGKITALLDRGSAEKKSRLSANRRVTTWDKFKTMVGKLPPDRYIFRGQPVCNRLRTSFHRTNRRDLYRFLNVDVPNLHSVVSSKLNHYFDLKDNLQNAAFYNLLQHHGYPTPLLDWTHSPYVAAYFAYREKVPSIPDPKRKIRIFKFARDEWIRDFNQLRSLVNVQPHFSILTPIALENPRALPQQAICSITTVDDVEEYLIRCGLEKNKNYIEVFELSYNERPEVLSELRLMGVAAGSLFPGIDGACEEMRLRNFGV